MSEQIEPTHQVVGTAFSFYTASEILRTSVKEVTNAAAFDSMGHPVPRSAAPVACRPATRLTRRTPARAPQCSGLYDPSLGPTDQNSLCMTCGLTYKDCPGHMGHIALSVPVYHPLLFNLLFKLLRMKCMHCHKCVGEAARQ